MVKLKRLKINKYRNVRPGTELRFDDGFNLILGKNGGGKTTLLSLISFVYRSVFKEIEQEEFSFEYQLGVGPMLIDVKVEHRPTKSKQGADTSTPSPWRDYYDFSIYTSDNKILKRVSLRETYVNLFQNWSFIALALADQEPLEELRLALHHACDSAYRFDESLESFAAMTGRESSMKGPATPPSSFFRLEEQKNGQAHRFNISSAYIPRPLIDALVQGRRSDPIRLGDAQDSFTMPLIAALEAKHVEAFPRTSERRDVRFELFYRVEGFDIHVTSPTGSDTHHERLSYGQKRLVAFFYYLASNADIVIADELVNGLHHRWIEACMDAIGDRQAFLTSQNPLLFDYVPDFKSVEQVQSRFITCRTEIVDGAEQLVWQNMPHEHARIFFEAYKDEVEQVGEILIARGLW